MLTFLTNNSLYLQTLRVFNKYAFTGVIVQVLSISISIDSPADYAVKWPVGSCNDVQPPVILHSASNFLSFEIVKIWIQKYFQMTKLN